MITGSSIHSSSDRYLTLVHIKGSSRFCNIAWQMGSSGIRTPTCLLFAYLVEEPCFIHCLGNCLLAGKINV
uniref:Uncharacterized protein n=1 Tax=Zea mays TaxID=4577 RepID=C0PB19_MAIZE|nr:unknown [Zea mays]